MRDGLRRMYGEDSENVYYYLTMYNEPIEQPAEPADVDVEGSCAALSLPASATERRAAVRRCWPAARPCPRPSERCDLLRDDWGVNADLWSVTSWVELHRDGLARDDAQPARTRVRTSQALRDADAWWTPRTRHRSLGLSARRPRAHPAMGAGDFTRSEPTASAYPTLAVHCGDTSS